MSQHCHPSSTDTFVTLVMEKFLALPVQVLALIEAANIQTWTRNGYVLVGLSLPEFQALLEMFPVTADSQPRTYSARVGEA
jgi:hypothetical protein